MQFIDEIPLALLVAMALTLGLAPFVPEQHIWEKLKMLAAGDLRRAVDWFDLLLHATPWVLLAIRLIRMSIRG
jgi:hypothetical protein